MSSKADHQVQCSQINVGTLTYLRAVKYQDLTRLPCKINLKKMELDVSNLTVRGLRQLKYWAKDNIKEDTVLARCLDKDIFGVSSLECL